MHEKNPRQIVRRFTVNPQLTSVYLQSVLYLFTTVALLFQQHLRLGVPSPNFAFILFLFRAFFL